MLVLIGEQVKGLITAACRPKQMNQDPAIHLTGIRLEFLLIAGIWYGSLKLSHRIAGPVYVFDREISRVGAGDLTAKINLRDMDMFQPEAQSINDSIAALKDRLVKIKELAGQLQQTHSGGGDVGPLSEQLAAALAEIKT